jgi:hypothetical protein
VSRVVHVDDGFDVYIGRRNNRRRLPQSKWANPYSIPNPEQPGDRERVIARYANGHLPAHPELLADLPELRGKTLGCWCKPVQGFRGQLLCHGQILAGLADGCPSEEIE